MNKINKKRTIDVLNKDNIKFNDLNLPENIIKGLNDADLINPSPIQLKAIPICRFGNDIIAQAKAGTGKTCVFTVCILENIDYLCNLPQALILSPTREIAIQTCDVIEKIGKYYNKLRCKCIVGGIPFERHKEYIREGCQIIVGTPGRIYTLLNTGILDPSHIKMFVLDEADELLDEQFTDSVSYIYSQLPVHKQVMAFSATFSKELLTLIKTFMRNPQYINCVKDESVEEEKIELCLKGVKQYCLIIKENETESKFIRKVDGLLYFLSHISFHQCVIFLNNHDNALKLNEIICSRGWPSVYMNGSFSQTKRNQIFTTFKEFRARILISTDLISRGIDIQRVNCVINFELPKSKEIYLHRIGRTGRFGSYGISLIICNEKELYKIKILEKEIGYKINNYDYSLDVTKYLPELDEIEKSMLDEYEKYRENFITNLHEWPFPLTKLPSLQLLE